MEKSKQEPAYREGTPKIESVARETVLPKFAPEQFLELPLYRQRRKADCCRSAH
ncbi:hypothetical protein [Paenibacillus phocaensis]|uniref:hypothetical protein n=1 Tax=Paenibacillus phocaensis TaxID=1776378 RepID=UPI000A9C3170|nr:hypothetical protein [Paenibacillus phocaensis]